MPLVVKPAGEGVACKPMHTLSKSVSRLMAFHACLVGTLPLSDMEHVQMY